MARILHGMPINTLPDPGELQDGDQIVAYREDTGKAYRSDIAGLGAAANHNISDEFSVVTKYSVGDYCIYNNTLYKCVADHTGDWNENDFEKVTVCDELEIAHKGVVTTEKFSKSSMFGRGYIITPSWDVSKAGYTPVGIIGYEISGNGIAYGNVYNLYLDGNEAHISLSGLSDMTASANTWTVTITVLYVKD